MNSGCVTPSHHKGHQPLHSTGHLEQGAKGGKVSGSHHIQSPPDCLIPPPPKPRRCTDITQRALDCEFRGLGSPQSVPASSLFGPQFPHLPNPSIWPGSEVLWGSVCSDRTESGVPLVSTLPELLIHVPLNLRQPLRVGANSKSGVDVQDRECSVFRPRLHL